MKILRFLSPENETIYGVLDGNNQIKQVKGSIYEPFTLGENTYNLDEVKLLSPCEPSKIVCVGLNYKAHIEEFKRDREGLPEEPVLFIKPSTAVIGPDDAIIYPAASDRVDYEGELAVVIGKKTKDVSEEASGQYILGYTCAVDVTARDLQRKDGQWTRGKGFDTFAPLGPWIETELDTGNLDIALYLNEQMKQSSNTNKMIFSIPRLVSFISGIMTLLPGDVIMTGTPEGVGPMLSGDQVRVEIQGIGTLKNTIVKRG